MVSCMLLVDLQAVLTGTSVNNVKGPMRWSHSVSSVHSVIHYFHACKLQVCFCEPAIVWHHGVSWRVGPHISRVLNHTVEALGSRSHGRLPPKWLSQMMVLLMCMFADAGEVW